MRNDFKRNRLARGGAITWYCNNQPMDEEDHAQYLSRTRSSIFPNGPTDCYPVHLDLPPAPPVASSAPANITLTQIQSPTQSQASGQESNIGSSRPTQTGLTADDVTNLFKQFQASQQPQYISAPTPQASVNVSSEPAATPSGQDFMGFFNQNKIWIIGGAAALIAFVIWQNSKKK